MTCFLDTSAIVKLFVAEADHQRVRALAGAPIVMVDLTLVEFPAALHRKQRMGELTGKSAQLLTRAFRSAVMSPKPGLELCVVASGVDVLDTAAQLVARYPLRAYDAVQLASGVAASAAIQGCAFGSFDEQLNQAALAEGLTLAF